MPELCGNQMLDEGEACDDSVNGGSNDGGYGHCNPDCMSMGPHCGDGNVDAGEEDCDDGDAEPDDNDGCPLSCQADHYLVFVTAQGHDGKLAADAVDTLDAADDICHAEAMLAGLRGAYAAWLSSSEGSAADRILTKVGAMKPLRRRDGEIVANNKFTLASEPLMNPISRVADPRIIADVKATVWTNTAINGAPTSSDADASCTNWTLNAASLERGFVGMSDSVSSSWTDDGDQNCSIQGRFYCFQISF